MFNRTIDADIKLMDKSQLITKSPKVSDPEPQIRTSWDCKSNPRVLNTVHIYQEGKPNFAGVTGGTL